MSKIIILLFVSCMLTACSQRAESKELQEIKKIEKVKNSVEVKTSTQDKNKLEELTRRLGELYSCSGGSCIYYETDLPEINKLKREIKNIRLGNIKEQYTHDFSETEADSFFERLNVIDSCYQYTYDEKNSENSGAEKGDYWDIDIKEKVDKCLKERGLIND